MPRGFSGNGISYDLVQGGIALSETTELLVIDEHPFNAETPMALLDGSLTRADQFYVRNHFAVPEIDIASWELAVTGAAGQGGSFSLGDLQALTDQSITMTMECAGNARVVVEPSPPGTQWNFSAAGTASFTGIPLSALLDRVAPMDSTVEVLFRGADEGDGEPGRHVRYERALTMEQARRSNVLLAWAMNGEPLLTNHGAPLRLVVPGWYGMASVKWLVEIQLLEEPFYGFFQGDRYIYQDDDRPGVSGALSTMLVRSVISSPAAGAAMAAGAAQISGAAWCGDAAIAGVQVSPDGGASWADAELSGTSEPAISVGWSATVSLAAGAQLVARATDSEGRTQPLEPVFNKFGYGNNSVHRVDLGVS